MQHGNTATKASVKPGLRKAYPVHATYRSYEIPQERWHELMLARRQFKNKLSHNCQCLIEFVNDANVMFAELGFENTEAMISYWYHLQPEEIAVAVEWLRLNPEDRPSSIWLAPIVPITINEDESLPLYSGDMRATYQASDVPRELWSELAHARWHFMELHFSADFRCLIEGVQDANAMFAELGFANVEAMIRDGYQLRPEQIALAMEWLRLNPQDEQPQQAYPPDPPTAEEIKHAENDAFTRFAKLGFEKVRTMLREGYRHNAEHDAFDAEDTAFAIQWLRTDPAAVNAANLKFSKLGYEKVKAVIDSGVVGSDEGLQEEEIDLACSWLLDNKNEDDPIASKDVWNAAIEWLRANPQAANDENAMMWLTSSRGKTYCLPLKDIALAAEDAADAAADEPDAAALKTKSKVGVTLDAFVAYMPLHNYIYIPTREPWPGSSVNARIPPIKLLGPDGKPLLDKKGDPKLMSASTFLDKYQPVEQMTWAPGLDMKIKDRLVAEGGWFEQKGATTFNLYRPPTLIPGDATQAQPWLDHVFKIYPTDANHIIDCLAHRVQRPYDKINHGLVLGGLQGIGKDTILEPVKRGIGPWNFSEVSPEALVGRFNGFLKAVILRVNEARDLGEVNRFRFYEHLKPFMAAPPDVLPVDEKNLREHKVFNVCFVIITTNYKTDGIYLPADDRRHYVAWSDLTKDDFDVSYWNKLWGWYDNGGDRHVMAYLMSRDLSAFDAKRPPPKTEAFWAIVNSNRAPEEGELADVFDELGNPDAVTIDQITEAAQRWTELYEWINDRKNRRAIPHRLEQCGYVPVRNSTQKQGLWIIGGKRYAIYAKSELSIKNQIKAATLLQGALDIIAKKEKTVWEKAAEAERQRKAHK